MRRRGLRVTKVLIIQSEMKHYRVPFFTGLYKALRLDGIELTVAYSNSHPAHALRRDSADLPPAFGRKVRGRWFFKRLLYQPLWREILASDLVIVGPEIKYLINPVLLVMSWLGLKIVAFWGLGPNRHPTRSRLAEWVKKHFFTCVNWWFAYTASISQYLANHGMPANKITTVQNATDTAELRRLMATISNQEALAAKEALTGSRDSFIGLYCGLIGEIKSLPLLLDAARLVKQQCPEFHLVLIGSGPDRPWLESAIADEPWIHYLGSRYGRESALYYKMSDAFLMAGTAGLSVVDSFAAGLPLLATEMTAHPPEISYVVNGENGRLAPHEAAAFANSIAEVLSNRSLLEGLRRGAYEAGSKYTMEAMVERFRAGIKNCLLHYGAIADIRMPALSAPEVES
jgi:L-malate glycosyltransferase